MMSRHFVPDKHIRIRREHEAKKKKQETQNQPTIGLFFVWPHYYAPNKEVFIVSINFYDTEKSKTIIDKMSEKLGVDLNYYPSVWGDYDVKPMGSVTCKQMRRVYMEAYNELFNV